MRIKISFPTASDAEKVGPATGDLGINWEADDQELAISVNSRDAGELTDALAAAGAAYSTKVM